MEGCRQNWRSLLRPSAAAALQVDQAELETVLPAPGGVVVVVRGARRGEKGEMLEIDVDKFRARVALGGSGEKAWFEYEDVCKLAS